MDYTYLSGAYWLLEPGELRPTDPNRPPRMRLFPNGAANLEGNPNASWALVNGQVIIRAVSEIGKYEFNGKPQASETGEIARIVGEFFSPLGKHMSCILQPLRI